MTDQPPVTSDNPDDPVAGADSTAARLAREIKRRRHGAGLSQPQLAQTIGYTRQYVSLAERIGQNLPSQELIQALDTALNADGALLALRAQAKAEQRARRHTSDTALTPPDTSLTGTGTLGATVNYKSEGWVADECAFERTLRTAADESVKFLTWAETVNVGDFTIEQIHGEIRRLARNYLKAPTLPLFGRARDLRDRIFTLLSGHQRPSQGRDLYSAAGWSLTLLAWISIDLGHPDAAEEHLRTAWLCADNADQNSLRAWIRATQHTAARWRDDFVKAAQYAEDGLQYASSGSAELFLASAWALDLTRCGDLERSQIALSRAREAAENVDNRADDLAGPFSCSEGRAGGFWSDVHLALDQPAEALSIANQAIYTFESTSNDARNLGSERMVRCRQVQAHLLLNELDGARETLLPVLATAPEHRVRPLAQMVENIAQMTIGLKYRNSLIASDIRDAAVEFGKNRVQKSLPS